MQKHYMTLEELRDSRLLYDKKVPAFGYMIIVTVVLLIVSVVVWSVFTPKVDIVKSSGVIESENKTYVMSPYTGEISEIFIEEGSVVEKGDSLVVVKSADMNLQVTQLEEQKKTYAQRVSPRLQRYIIRQYKMQKMEFLRPQIKSMEWKHNYWH